MIFNCIHTLACLISPLDLTLEEKVGQVLMVGFRGEEANQDAQTLIQKLHVGGIIYYNWSNGLTSPRQVSKLSQSLQSLSRIPLFIAVDQEGGLVTRLAHGFTIFPGNRALGMTDDPSLAEACAFAMGQEMADVGVNFNLAPVVDINSNPRNPVIGIRSFGETTEIVTAFGKKSLEGYHRAGILTSLKHFPGHGDVATDSHLDLPVTNKSKEELEKVELRPFSCLASETDSIMTAHLMVPSIDPKNCATLSKPILSILRHEMGYKGLIITDSLVMEGVLKNSPSIDEAAIGAFNAGCDVILLGGRQLHGEHSTELSVSDIARIHQSFVKAVQNGRISENRLNESIDRILSAKKRFTYQKEPFDSGSHEALAKQIASRALKVTGSLPSYQTPAVFAPEILQAGLDQKNTFFFKNLDPEEMQTALKSAEKADLLVFYSFNAWKTKSQADLINALLATGKPLALIVTRDPLDAELFPEAKLIIRTYSPTPVSLQAAESLWKNAP